MKASLSPEGVDFTIPLESETTVILRFRQIRRERTGIHALLAILFGEVILTYDNLNIERREERQRLGNAAHKRLPGDVTKDALSQDQLNHYLDIAVLQTPRIWEQDRLQIVQYQDIDQPPPVVFAVKPYIIHGGGTVFFGPPGAGKTYIMQSMALAISAGQVGVWNVQQQCPVLYVNLERDGNSLWRRELALRQAMGIKRPDVSYLHARGMPLQTIYQKVKGWLMDKPENGAAVMLDSISRAGQGSLIEDESANRFVDLMNSLPARWWAAIGHTPRGDSEHLFGSIHFDAGMDIGVQVKTEPRENEVGLALKITKANDIGHFKPQYLALEFGAPDAPIRGIRTAAEKEFPDLLGQMPVSLADQVCFLLSGESMTAELLSRKTGKPEWMIKGITSNDPRIESMSNGKQVVYALKG